MRQHGIGYDGWTRDYVFTLPVSDVAATQATIADLSALIFQSAHKAYASSISGSHQRSKPRLSFQVGPAELHRWLSPQQRLLPVEGGAPISVDEAFGLGHSAVYFSEKPGLVVWPLRRGQTLDGLGGQARQFALESDLILGALSRGNTVLIVARERQAPVDVLPPLRYEMLVDLASVTTTELAQSFERTNFFAGKYDDTHDWAPAYLSPELIDTEFGSLLDLADQILKSHSNHGETRYANFTYPDPPTWPFPSTVAAYLNTHTLTYNWNTSTSGALVEDADSATYWVRDTGALTVTYLPGVDSETSGDDAAERAHTYFAAQNDPILARVTQYTTLYQIFLNFGIHGSAADTAVDLSAANAELQQKALVALRRLGAADVKQLADAAIARANALRGEDKETRRLVAADVEARLGDVAALIGNSSDSEQLRVLSEVSEAIASPDRYLDAIREKIMLGESLSDSELARVGSLDFARTLTDYAPELRDFAGPLVGVRDAFQKKAADRAERNIRTPSIVVSSNHGSLAGGTGGHNVGGVPAGGRLGELALGAGRRPIRVDELTLGARGLEFRKTPVRESPAELLANQPSQSDGSLRGFVGDASLLPIAPTRHAPVAESARVIKIAPNGAHFVVRGESGSAEVPRSKLVSTVVAMLQDEPSGSLALEVAGLNTDELRVLGRSVELRSGHATVEIVGPPHMFSGFSVDVASAEDVAGEAALVKISDAQATEKLAVFGKPPSKGGLRSRVKAAVTRLRAAFGDRSATVDQLALELKAELADINDLDVIVESCEGADQCVSTRDGSPLVTY